MKRLMSNCLLDCGCFAEVEVPSVIEIPLPNRCVIHNCIRAGKIAEGKVVKASSAYWDLTDDPPRISSGSDEGMKQLDFLGKEE